MQAHRKDDWDVETDLLVIGAGAAGMTAAVVGALEGLKVVLCEKSDVVGGTSAFSAGSVWIPGSSQARTAGTPDTIEAARTYLGALLGSDADDPRLGARPRQSSRWRISRSSAFPCRSSSSACRGAQGCEGHRLQADHDLRCHDSCHRPLRQCVLHAH